MLSFEPRPWWPIAAIALLTAGAGLYVLALASAPIHLHYDEILLGVQAHSLATTGRDTNNRLLPLYFQVDVNVWYQPVAVYATALALRLIPLSDAAVRLPTALAGLTNIALTYLIARHLLRRASFAWLAALLLALTPAHFIHSRIAAEYIWPLPFALGWVLCLMRYMERADQRWLFAATGCLGVGVFTYIASVVMMPLYLALTCLVLLSTPGVAPRAYAIALAGFALPLLALPPFLAAHPGLAGDYADRYGLFAASGTAHPLQGITAIVNPRTIAERWNLWYDFFSPGFLFVSGGSNLTNSTRTAGVFLAPLVVFLPIGVYDVLTRCTREKGLMLLGFLTAPVAALVVVENYAIDRALALVPFGVLLATLGVARLWPSAYEFRLRRIYVPLSAGLVLAGLGVLWMVYSGDRAAGAPWWAPHAAGLSIAGGIGAAATGHAVETTRRWSPVVVLLLLAGVIQFGYFVRDYFGDYGPRAAEWFGNNIRGSIEQVIALDAEQPAPIVLFASDIRHAAYYWRFYVNVHRRPDLLGKARVHDFRELDIASLPDDSLLVAPAGDRALDGFVRSGVLRQAATVTDPSQANGHRSERVTYVIHRKVARGLDHDWP